MTEMMKKMVCLESVQKNPKLTLTRPKDPELETAQRYSPVKLKSSAELEEEMMAKFPKFKARPLNKKTVGMQAIDEIVLTLLHAKWMFDVDGLKQILSIGTSAVLPHILPKLVHLKMYWMFLSVSGPVLCCLISFPRLSTFSLSAFNAIMLWEH
ncbi:PREDICTED: uncharacterized protein LOC109169963 [Ipomoea nil]|uniref:uncharacterized protein LOC109169963 n=1 Tax=Ipomoea nil TaxID=35883 RepID=UPI0009016D43|nr:PREDICTED: uncharacterized protein LOC109169963 [Ipomoea nil]